MPRQEAKSLLVSGRGKHEYLQNLNTLIKAERNREAILAASLDEVQKALEDGPKDDAHWSACFILACAVSLDVQAMSKLPKSFKTHFVEMRGIESTEICEKVITILVSKILDTEGSPSSSFKLLGKLLEVCQEKSALFAILLIRNVLENEYASVITHRMFWKHAYNSLSQLSKDKVDEKLILSLFTCFERKTVEAIGTLGFSSLTAMPNTFESYLMAFETVWKLLSPQSLDSPQSESIALLLLLLAKINVAFESTSCFKTAFTVSMDSTKLSGEIFDSLRKISDGSSDHLYWLEEQNMDPFDLVMNLIFTGTDKIATPSCLAMQLDNIIFLIFAALPSYWSHSSQQYEKIFEQVTDCLFKITSYKSGSSPKPKYWNQIVSSCHAHLFSPHPLVHNMALDLWCLIIRGSHKDANKEVAPQIGQLLLHLADRLFPSSATPKIESILANDAIVIKARSIAYRVLSSLPRHMQADIDKAFTGLREQSSIMKLFNMETVSPSDKDLFMLDVLPLKLMVPYKGIDQILLNLVLALPRELDASPRAYLSLRVIYRLVQLPTERYTEETVRTVNQKLGSLNTIFKPSNLSYHEIEKKSELISLVFDILGEIKPLKLVMWKMWLMNLTPHIAFLSPNIKIAFVQFLSKILLQGDVDVKDDMTGVSRVITQLIQDKDWKVASEAILGYSSFQKRFPLSIEMKTALSKLVEQLEDQGPEQQTKQEIQLLVSSNSPPKELAVKEAISSLRVTIQRYSEHQDSHQHSDLLAEFSQTLAKLTRLEQKLSLSSTSTVIV